MNLKIILNYTKQPFDKAQAVYLIYNENEVLIYVGVTNDVLSRIAQHRRDKDWRNEICSVTVLWHETRHSALAQENQIIEFEQPIYNVRKPRKQIVCELCNGMVRA